MGLPKYQYELPFTDTGKKQWRRDFGPLMAFEVRHGNRTVLVAARDSNDAKITALDPLRKACTARNDTEKERVAQYIELRVTRRPDLDKEATSRGEIIL